MYTDLISSIGDNGGERDLGRVKKKKKSGTLRIMLEVSQVFLNTVNRLEIINRGTIFHTLN